MGGEKTLAPIEVSKVPLTFRKLLRTGRPLIVNPCKNTFGTKMKRNRKSTYKIRGRGSIGFFPRPVAC